MSPHQKAVWDASGTFSLWHNTATISAKYVCLYAKVGLQTTTHHCGIICIRLGKVSMLDNPPNPILGTRTSGMVLGRIRANTQFGNVDNQTVHTGHILAYLSAYRHKANAAKLFPSFDPSNQLSLKQHNLVSDGSDTQLEHL